MAEGWSKCFKSPTEPTWIWLVPQMCSLATPVLLIFNQQCPNSQWLNNDSTKSATLQWNTFIKIIYPGNRFFTNERKGLFYSQSVGWIFTIHLQIPFKDFTVYGLNFNHFNHWQSASSEYLSTADSNNWTVLRYWTFWTVHGRRPIPNKKDSDGLTYMA